jgi:hypothetical protein
MTRRVRLVALAAAALLVFAACANNDAKRSDVVNAMRDALVSEDMTDAEVAEAERQAECIGDGIDEAFSDDQDLYNEVAAVVETDEFDDLPDDAGEQVNAVLAECIGGESGTDGDSGDSGDGDTTDTTEGDDATTESTESSG